MKVTISDWEKANIQDIALLTYKVLQRSPDTRRNPWTLEAITSWLHNLTFESPFTGSPVVIVAYDETLLGWLMLCNTGSKTAEVVPWSLPIRPILAPDHDRTEVMTHLLEKAVTWARKEGVTTILLRVDKQPGHEYDQVNDITWYESLGFTVREDTVYMDYYITGDEEDPDCFEGVELTHVTDVERDDLYQCYYDTFSAGQSPFFFDQNDVERRESFDLLFESESVDEDTSLAIVNGSKVVGFSFTKSYRTEGNVLLEWIGIHPQYRRRGLGEFLLRCIMKKVAEHGVAAMSLSCAVGNTRASQLYQKCGWRVEGGETIFALRV